MLPFPTSPRFWLSWTEQELRARKNALDAYSFRITQQQGTEPAFSHPAWDSQQPGLYVDKVSGEPLFCSLDKYQSGTGWPSFVQAVNKQAVLYRTDNTLDTPRTEVISRVAKSHLGHVFNDGPHPHSTRYCINRHALHFHPKETLAQKGYGEYLSSFFIAPSGQHQAYHQAVFACGCFWSVQSLFNRVPGVIRSVCGYTGGHDTQNTTYANVCTGNTGHAEAVLLYFDPDRVSFATLAMVFFKIHDPTTPNQQGNDVGSQYRSAIFYTDNNQKRIASDTIEKAKHAGYFHAPIVTQLQRFTRFYIAECLHQHYLDNFPHGYHCHRIDSKVFPECHMPS